MIRLPIMTEHLPGLPYRLFRVTFKARSAVHLRGYPGFALRGLFGTALRAVTCATGLDDCSRCSVPHGCLYMRLFESPGLWESATIHNRSHQPHPLILTPLSHAAPAPDSTGRIAFTLMTLGSYADLADPLWETFREMGRMGIGNHKVPLRLMELEIFNGWEWTAWNPLADSQPLPLTAHNPPMTIPYPLNWLQVTLMTPLRLRRRRREIGRSAAEPNISFAVLIGSLLGRLADLWHLYGLAPLPLDIASLKQQALEITTVRSALTWHDYIHHSRRQGAIRTGGLLGHFCCEGDLSPFFPWLVMGERLHLGSSTVVGFGCYRLGWLR